MTERSPIPACLSHLTQRDAAVRARALKEAAQIAQDIHDKEDTRGFATYAEQHDRTGICLGALRCRDAIRRLIPTPPAPAPDEARGPHNACGAGSCDQPDRCASEGECHYTKSPFYQPSRAAPDEAAIRVELVAALRGAIEHWSHIPDEELQVESLANNTRAKALLAARAALAKATS